ncbi:SRPBCC family protein [Gorillibacterium sp. sgz5001074]|uniref:SRPBCC family protein n=1 Tax=Gorillibacterium sp. sgz5001074 TaxID=3446695 RepID=UPI003F675BDA
MSKQAELVITRTIDAPKELVFQAFTQAEHLKNWWGPKGLELSVLKLDVRPGGVFHYGMQTPDGQMMYGIFHYREIEAPNRLVFSSGFADEAGNLIRAPFSAVFPMELLNEYTFTEENGKTVLTLRGEPLHATEEEAQFYASMKENMEQGFGGTFGKLDEYLATL